MNYLKKNAQSATGAHKNLPKISRSLIRLLVIELLDMKM